MIWELMATGLATLGMPYAADADRSILGDELPDLYMVYGLVSGNPQQDADDAETERFYRMQVSIFNRTGLNSLPDTDTALFAQGFRFSRETAIPFNPETGHYGLAREYTILINQ